MSNATHPAGLSRIQGETLSLSSTRASLGLLRHQHQLMLHNPIEDWRLHFNPALLDVVFYDASASANSRFIKEGSTAGASLQHDLTDRDSGSGTGTVIDSMTTSDFLYLCFSDPIGGMRIVMKSVSSAGSNNTIAFSYFNGGADFDAGAWTGVTETDGTASGSKTLGQTGDLTFTAPTDWVPAVLAKILANDNTNPVSVATGVLVNDGSFGSGDTTLAVDTVDATTIFKNGDVFALDSELLQITAVVSSTSLTVVRGVQGTSAASHNNDKELFRQRAPTSSNDVPGRSGFWCRLAVETASLDSDTEIEEIWAINKDTNRGFFQAGVEYHFSIDRTRVGSFEAVTTANTDTLEVTHVKVVQ